MLERFYTLVLLAISFPSVISASVPQEGYQNPLDSGGSMLTVHQLFVFAVLPKINMFSIACP